ncbi:MAG: bifunctional ADP-dependent NAD(P)H-hydrate dehydratase/NAD(P)H-hydrate epimerase, partial [Nocardioides sp.]|nr:bifunctional ADP-dependent NAD(P)H-hydrate dehydratase/NAD(P)H-hydrate epimerase [Nocardioides sp.]
MLRAHTVENVRRSEAEAMARLPEGALMQRAAAGLATAVVDLLDGCYGRRVLLLVGSGDNGGDALWTGARLAGRGARVEALLLGERVHEAGLAALHAAGGRSTRDLDALDHAPDVVVDAIVGIGGRPGLRPDAVAALTRFALVPLVAVDVPSGVGGDPAHRPGPPHPAAHTLTVGPPHHPHHLAPPAPPA